MVIQNFKVEYYNMVRSVFGYVVCPKRFSAKIEGTETMKQLVEEAEKKIRSSDMDERNNLNRTDIWTAFNNRSTITFKSVDKKLGLGSLALLTQDGESFRQGIYGLKKDETTLKGILLNYDYRGKIGGTEKHFIDSFENGILKGRIQDSEGEINFENNLKRILW